MPDPTFSIGLDSQGLNLTPEQKFEIERHNRLLDSINDVTTLRNMAKLLLQSWMCQKAATAWALKQGLRR